MTNFEALQDELAEYDAWNEIVAENAADQRERMISECCACGAVLGDHYDTKNELIPCDKIASDLRV